MSEGRGQAVGDAAAGAGTWRVRRGVWPEPAELDAAIPAGGRSSTPDANSSHPSTSAGSGVAVTAIALDPVEWPRHDHHAVQTSALRRTISVEQLRREPGCGNHVSALGRSPPSMSDRLPARSIVSSGLAFRMWSGR